MAVGKLDVGDAVMCEDRKLLVGAVNRWAIFGYGLLNARSTACMLIALTSIAEVKLIEVDAMGFGIHLISVVVLIVVIRHKTAPYSIAF